MLSGRWVAVGGWLIERHTAQRRRSGAHVRRCFINPGHHRRRVFGPTWSRPRSNVIRGGGGIRQKPSCDMGGGGDACPGYG